MKIFAPRAVIKRWISCQAETIRHEISLQTGFDRSILIFLTIVIKLKSRDTTVDRVVICHSV